MVDTHIAYMKLTKVNAVGQVLTGNDPLSSHLNFSTEFRIIPDSSLPNTANYPTLAQYLLLEAASNYEVRHVDQNMVMTIKNDASKIDSEAVDGLLGADDSLAYKVHEIEKHFHNEEKWYGSGGGGLAEENNTTPWSISSGTPADTFSTPTQLAAPNTFPQVKYDVHRIFISNVATNNNTYLIRFLCGPTAGSASVITTVPYRVATASRVSPQDVIFGRRNTSDGLWVSVQSSTAGSAIDFIIGIHTYIG